MFDAIENAFPHLIRALRRANGMTHMEAVGVIYAHRYGDGCGGLISRAVRQRETRRTYRLAA